MLITSRTFWLISVILICVIMIPVNNGDWLFSFPKIILFASIILLSGITIFLNRDKLISRIGKIPLYLLLSYLAWTLMTNTILSSQPDYTLLGWIHWYGGYFTNSLYVILILLAATTTARATSDKGKWIGILAIFSIFYASICFLEVLGFNPLIGSSWFTLGAGALDLGSASYPVATIGNSGWVAGLWILISPLAFLLADRVRFGKIWQFSTAIGVASVHSKSVAILYILSVVVAIVYGRRQKSIKAGGLIYLAALCLIGLSSFGLIQSAASFLYDRNLTSRPPVVATLDAGAYQSSFSGRLLIYKSTLRMISERPLQGWGLETLQSQFYEHLSQEEYIQFISPVVGLKDGEDVRRFGNLHVVVRKNNPGKVLRMQFFDVVKPHSIILEEIYSNGIVGAALVFSAIILIMARSLRYGGFQEKSLIIACVLYIIYASVWFYAIAVTPFFCVFLAFASRGSYRTAGHTLSSSAPAAPSPAAPPPLLRHRAPPRTAPAG